MQKRTAFRHFLQLLGDVRLIPSFVSYVVSRGSLSTQTIHTRLTFPKTDVASNTYSSPFSTSPPETPTFVRVPLAILPAFFLRVQQTGIQWNRRFAPNDPALHQPHGEMESFQKRNRFGYFLCDSVSAADDRSLHRHQVRHQFRGRPFLCFRLCFPLLRRNRVRRPKGTPFGRNSTFQEWDREAACPYCIRSFQFCVFRGSWKIERAAITARWHKRFRASRRQPVQMHAPAAAPALPQTLARRSAALQAAGLQGGRTAQRSLAAPPAIP
jgi:hypothetical protein